MDLPPGVPATAERFGKFLRVAKLGAGGMGEVWKAWDTELSRWVALKFMHAPDEEELVRFRREAQLAGKLRHPNIAAIHEVGEANGKPFIAMEFVDGDTLKSVREPRDLARLVRDAARAVDYAHGQGVIHRDLKPDNLMVAREAAGLHIYVMDFGLAKHVSGAGLSRSGSAIGTPSFMSPEQARGDLKSVDPRSDVWGLGATLFERLGGRPIFEGDVYDVLLKVASEDPPRLRSFATVDGDLETIVMKCLERDPSRRYATAAALADDLDRWLQGEAIQARPTSWVYRLRKRVARRKGIVGTVVGALLLLGIGGAIAWIVIGRSGSALVDEMKIRAAESLEDALALRRAGDVQGMTRYAERVEASCRKVMTSHPELAEPHYVLGRMHRAMMRDQEALVQQEEALRLDPSHALARYERIVLCSRTLAERAKELEEEAWRAEGERLSASGTVKQIASRSELVARDAAARAMRERLAEDVRRIEGSASVAEAQKNCARGLRAMAEGRLEEARGLLAGAVATEEVADAVAIIELERKQYDAALEIYDRALQADVGNVLLRHHRAVALHQRGLNLWRGRQDAQPSYLAAIDDLEKVLIARPDRKAARMDLAKIVMSLGNVLAQRGDDTESLFTRALAEVDRVVREHPDDAEALVLRAQVRYNWGYARRSRNGRSGDLFAAALADLKEAATLGSLALELQLLRGMVHRSLASDGGTEAAWLEAERDFTAALERNPSDVRAWFYRGEARSQRVEFALSEGARQELFDRATADFDAAASRDPEAASVFQMRAAALHREAMRRQRAGQDPASSFALALRNVDDAVRLSPADDEILHLRGAVLIHYALWKESTGTDAADLWARSRKDLEALVARAPGRADGWNALGVFYSDLANRLKSEHRTGVEELDLRRRALEACDKAVQRNPIASYRITKAQSLGALASAQEREGRAPAVDLWRQAFDEFDRILHDDPEDTHCLVSRGIFKVNRALCGVLYRGTDPTTGYADGIQDYEEALRRNGACDEAYEARAHSHGLWGDYLKWRKSDPTEQYLLAYRDRDVIARRLPGQFMARSERAAAAQRVVPLIEARGEDPTKIFETMIEDYAFLVKVSPKTDGHLTECGAAKVNLASSGIRRGKDGTALLVDAVKDFDEALRLNPSNATAAWYRGNAYINQAFLLETEKKPAGALFRAARDSYRLGAQLGTRHESLVEALKVCEEYLKKHPDE